MILLASASQDDLYHWEHGVRTLSPIFCSTNLESLKIELARLKPSVLLLDYDLPQLNGPSGISALIKLHPEAKVIVLSHPLPDEAEWALFRTGVKGVCRRDIDGEQLHSVVTAVQRGELWIRRTLSWHLLNELVTITQEKTKIKQAVGELLANLTQREYEIATLVGNGESNKQIVRRLDITERTVKAHLTEVFRKLDIADRLKLALIVKGSIYPGDSSKMSH
ncbi:two component transcriptional regulator, LuxR family [Nitrosospira multiformis ATCC 25196]|uniref:Two component transcriptional regulator, LuxR family n=1 Tax=Nitrosospira multiformis (strain ATCC 25196 / NCIMB 11849 / C 71) TaxID=323848 RepID=A0A1H5UWX5_NITMU|nr:DNA-binding response regulator [Nitrosospira multiformis]SEF79470.1 two component transcriptional regulator, LuxR family [Nitrosospira multiformis ATCC 25196]